VQRRAVAIQSRRVQLMTTALRSFLRFARYRGDIDKDLAACVPGVANWRLSTIPRALPPDQVELDGSRNRRSPGRPNVDPEVEKLTVKMAKENRKWGSRRILGALANLGRKISHQTVLNILKRHHLPTAPEREKETTWPEFLKVHKTVLAACDFFTTEVLTWSGLVTYYVLFFIHVETRRVEIAGITRHPDQWWMENYYYRKAA